MSNRRRRRPVEFHLRADDRASAAFAKVGAAADRRPRKVWWRDALERVAWTAAAAAAGEGAVVAGHVPPEYAALVVVAFTALKVIVARHVGNPNSASLGGDA